MKTKLLLLILLPCLLSLGSGCVAHIKTVDTPAPFIFNTAQPTNKSILPTIGLTPTLTLTPMLTFTPTLPFKVSITKEEIPLRLWEPEQIKYLTDIRHLAKGDYLVMDESNVIGTDRNLRSLISLQTGKRYEFIDLINSDGSGKPRFYFEILDKKIFFDLEHSGRSYVGYRDLFTGESQEVIEGDEIIGGMSINPIMNGEYVIFSNSKIYSVKTHTLMTLENAYIIGDNGCLTSYRFCLVSLDLDGPSKLFLLKLDDGEMDYVGELCIPGYSNALCNESTYSWNREFSPDGRITYVFDNDPKKNNSNITIRLIETDCLMANNWNFPFCIGKMNTTFTFENANDRVCSKNFSWVGGSHDILFSLFDQSGPNNFSTTCPHKGTWLLSADGTQNRIKDCPAQFFERRWLPDNQWAVWVTGDGTHISTWGLYSPYNGGQIKELGQIWGLLRGVITIE
jgi:hypothetical protein